MVSAIDATKPADGIPANKAEIRANFAAAKSEISSLQESVGGLSEYIFAGMRNRLINSSMRLDQRNIGVAVVTAPTQTKWPVDRWSVRVGAGGGTITSQQQATGGPPGYPAYVRNTVTAAKTLVAADFHLFGQAVEGLHFADFMFGTADAIPIMVSFWVRASIAGTYAVRFVNEGATRSVVSTYNISQANTWERKTVTVTGDVTGTWTITVNRGVALDFDLGSGSTYHGIAGLWSAGTFTTAAGLTSLVSTNGATLDITGVQLERGNVATEYDHRLEALEILLCKRYFQRYDNLMISGYNSVIGAVLYNLQGMPIPMRAVPTGTVTTGASGLSGMSAPTVHVATSYAFGAQAVSTITGHVNAFYNITLDAETV